VVVVLGTPNPESSRLYALTVTEGDPAWAGVLAGTALRLPVYHITEPEIAAQVPPALYEQEVGVAQMVLDAAEIASALQEVRAQSRSV
jgi:glycine/sarcosine/betaine reductase complex component A